MAAEPILPFRVTDSNGRPYSGAKLRFYEEGTLTPQAVYADADLTTSLGAVLTADSGGLFPAAYFDSSKIYRGVCENATGSVTIFDMDPINFTGMTVVSSRTALAGIGASANRTAYLNEGDRSGWFTCKAGSPPSDTLQGIYVASDTGGFYWERQWDGINGLPEWFGATADSSTGSVPANNVSAITACLALCPVTLLGMGDYFTNAVIRVPPYRTLQGQGSYRAGSGSGTRIVVMSATADVLAVGLAAYPGSINDMAKQCNVIGLSVARDRPVTPAAPGFDSTCPCGVRMTFALHSKLVDVYSDDHSAGFYFNGVVRSIVEDCKAFRQTSGTTTTNDFFRGFWCDGGGSYGLSGGNGSLFLNYCNVSVGGSPTLTTSIGFLLNSAFVDTTLLQPEATATVIGIQLDGENNAAAPAHIDVDIDTPILDAIIGTGIEIKNTNNYAAVEIRGGYVGLTGATAFAGYHIHDCQGVTIYGGEVWGNVAAAAGANVLGAFIDTVGRLSIKDLKMIDCKRPYGLTAVADFQIDGLVNNYSKTGSQAAFDLTNCTIGRITASITGTGSAFPSGVSCNGTGNVRITVDPTGINPACITGGATNKVQINAIAITAPGYYTSAGAGGSSGAGINVTGITA